MSCVKKHAATAGRTRQVIADLFARDPKAAFSHRLVKCTRASPCGRLCHRLIKAPGLDSVHCCDPATGQTIHLYPALSDPTFHCPDSHF